VDPRDAGSIAGGIERVLDDDARAEAQRQRGLEKSRRFDWNETAALTLAFYREILGR